MSAVPQRQNIVDVNPSSASVPVPLPPMLVYPSLAEKLGLNEAVFIAQLHYWLEKSKHTRIEDGCRWIWNTVKDWLEQFRWMTRSTLERVIAKLEKLGVVLSQKFEKHLWWHRKWYRLDYKKLQSDYGWRPADKPQQKSSQTDKAKPVRLTESNTSNCGNRVHQNDGIISEITIQRLQKTHSSTEQETVCDFFEKDQEETVSSQQLPTPLEELETSELGSKLQSLASLREKPKPQRQPKDPDQGKTFRRDVVHETHELLKNPVFVQWWVKRVENSDLGKKLYMPPPVFVKNEIRKKPEFALDMWQEFQEEMTRRVEYFNQRQERGSHIPEYEREEISAIAPYSTVPLQPIRATLASATETSLEELIAQERQKIRMAQTNNRNEPSGRTTANNFPSSRLLTEEEIQARKKEILRHYNAESKSSVLVASDFSTNQSVNSNESG